MILIPILGLHLCLCLDRYIYIHQNSISFLVYISNHCYLCEVIKIYYIYVFISSLEYISTESIIYKEINIVLQFIGLKIHIKGIMPNHLLYHGSWFPALIILHTSFKIATYTPSRCHMLLLTEQSLWLCLFPIKTISCYMPVSIHAFDT